jgi:hypothetical protein
MKTPKKSYSSPKLTPEELHELLEARNEIIREQLLKAGCVFVPAPEPKPKYPLSTERTVRFVFLGS